MYLLENEFGSVARALALTLEKAKASGDKTIIIPKNIYHIYADEASAPVVCVANHGFNGFKPTALFISDTDGLTVDGEGSTFIMHGTMDFAIVQASRNITIKNLTVTCADTCNFQGRVVYSRDGVVKLKLVRTQYLRQFGDRVVQVVGDRTELLTRALDYVTETKQIRRGTGDLAFGVDINALKATLEGDELTFEGAKICPPVGDTIVTGSSLRIGQAFFVDKSKTVTFENVTINKCWGMGFIVQKSEDVTLDGCVIEPEEGNYWSAGQDASHFVNCRGTVTVKNCKFTHQLDDAVNLHGIYTVIEKTLKNKVLVRYGHHQTRGIDIYGEGDRVQALDRESQQPLAFATVEGVEVISQSLTVLTLKDVVGEFKPSMIVENLSDDAGAVISGNEFRDNRARGMLISAKGRVEISNNVFHSGGAAVQFESDPLFWLESGGTADVVIRDNVFDDCRHGLWGKAVIDIGKRKRSVEGFYYHGRIEVSGNRFTQTNVPCVAADNVKELIFSDNEYAVDEPIAATHSIVNGTKYE